MRPANARPPSEGRHQPPVSTTDPISDRLERWLEADGDHTLAGLIAVFEQKSFALIFILLMGVPALPLPTGGATHVFEIIAVLVAAQLVAGSESIRIPKRWREISLGAGRGRERFIRGLLRFMRFLERFSSPRMVFLFERRFSNQLFGLSVILFCVAAFFAPPFSGLDTLPALGVVLISIAVLLEDFVFVLAGLAVGSAGILLEITVGKAAADAIKGLF